MKRVPWIVVLVTSLLAATCVPYATAAPTTSPYVVVYKPAIANPDADTNAYQQQF
jgi:hypothetical protein